MEQALSGGAQGEGGGQPDGRAVNDKTGMYIKHEFMFTFWIGKNKPSTP
jgi:hypothetical protein